MRKQLFFLITLVHGALSAQELSKISGSITTLDFLPIEAHIWNTTQNSGTISTVDGKFEITTSLQDTLRISSVGYTSTFIIVEQKHFDNLLRITLKADVNELSEVTVLQYGLTGHLENDVKNVKAPVEQLPYFNAKYLEKIGVARPYDGFSPVKNPLLVNGNQNMVNLVPLVTALANLFAKNNEDDTPVDINTIFDENFITKTLEIPETSYYDFMDHLKEQSNFETILQSRDELKIFEFLLQQKTEFLNPN